MKRIVFCLLVPSLMMCALGVYWLSIVKLLDEKRTEFTESQPYKSYEMAMRTLLNGNKEATKEQYMEALRKHQIMVNWERGYYETIRESMTNLGWIAAFIGIVQFAGIYYLYRRLIGLPA